MDVRYKALRRVLARTVVERIDHGVTAIQSPALLQELAESRFPLTVCPLSNVPLKVFPSLKDHPLKTMLDRGLRVSVHSDDPPYFGGYVNETLLACARALHLSLEDIALLARNSFLSSFAPQEKV